MKPTPGSAELQRQAEALALADRDIGAKLAGRLQQAEREAFGRCRNRKRARAMRDRGGVAAAARSIPNALG